MIKRDIVGYGYWGPNLVRNFSESGDSEVCWVTDLGDDRLATVRSRYPAIRTTTQYRDLLRIGILKAHSTPWAMSGRG